MTIPPPAAPGNDIDEAGSLAMELANAYHQMAAFYHHQLELSGPDADKRTRGLDDSPQEAAEDTARIMTQPPDQLSWFDLNRLVNRDPEQMVEL